MKVLLLNPPVKDDRRFIREGRCTQEQGVWATLWLPLSLANIGAVLEKNGHEVRLVDCPAEGIAWGLLEDLVNSSRPEAVIWSTGTPSIQDDLEVASIVKKCNSKIFTGVFGTHVTVLDRQCMDAFPDVDCIIRNEPEITAGELINSLAAGRNPEGIEGLTFRNSAGDIIVNSPRPFIQDLDVLPFPAWHLVNLDRYRLPLQGRRFLMVAPLRGCPFNCSFCTCQTYYGKRLRKRSVKNVIEEIIYDSERFKINDFFIWAETFVVDKEYVASLCRAIIEKGLSISWTSNSRVDTVDPDLLWLMARAGCWMISFGIESGNQRILDGVGKGTNLKQAREAVRSAREAGIKTVGHFILGLPGETKESMEETIKYACSLGLDLAQFYCAVPFPGSRLYDHALEEGWITSNDYSSFKQDYALMRLPTVTPEEVSKYRDLAYRKFYFNPRGVFSTLRLVNWRDLKQLAASTCAFWGWSRKRQG